MGSNFVLITSIEEIKRKEQRTMCDRQLQPFSFIYLFFLHEPFHGKPPGMSVTKYVTDLNFLARLRSEGSLS